MRVLRAHGGMHAWVHRADPGEVSGPLDLRTLRGGDQGRDRAVQEADQYGRGRGEAHELLQQVQVRRGPTRGPRREARLGHETHPPEKPRLATWPEVNAEQSHFEDQRARPLRELFLHSLWRTKVKIILFVGGSKVEKRKKNIINKTWDISMDSGWGWN